MRQLLPLLLAGAAAPAFAQADPHAGHHMPAAPATPDEQAEPLGTDQRPGSSEAPPIAPDRAADRYWNSADMAQAQHAEMHPPKPVYSRITLDIAEYQFRQGKDGYRWEGEAWFGDLDRLVLKSKGEGTLREGIDHAEVQALYSKALDPWWNLQGGVRQDIQPGPSRSWATIGIEGRAPYLFEVQAAAFLSDKGEVTGRIEASYDQRITQRLILQPRTEIDLSAQDMPGQRIGAGLSSAEFGLRLRYEIKREFAPYMGISWTWLACQTAAFARADGHDTAERSVVAGVRFWF